MLEKLGLRANEPMELENITDRFEEWAINNAMTDQEHELCEEILVNLYLLEELANEETEPEPSVEKHFFRGVPIPPMEYNPKKCECKKCHEFNPPI